MSEEEIQSEGDQNNEPDIVNDIKTLNEAATKGPLSELLSPAAKVFGTSLGSWAESVTQKRKKNIESHIDAVKAKNPELLLDSTPAHAEELNEWVLGAGKYNTDDGEAPLWRSIFEDILSGEADMELIKIAKLLNHEDLQQLAIAKIEKINLKNNYNLEKLERIGLIRRLETYRYDMMASIIMALLLVYYLFTMSIYNLGSTLGTPGFVFVTTILFFSALSFVQTREIIVGVFKRVSYKHTSTGNLILHKYLKYKANQ